MAASTDSAIINLIEEGRYHESFQILVKKYQRPLYWHIRKIVIGHEDADDVLQEVFIKAWRKIKTFKGRSSLYTWLYRIATNESLNYLKKGRRNAEINNPDIQKELSDKLESAPYFSGSIIDKKLQQAILKLPEKQRLVFNMKYFDEMKYKDMAKILNQSEGALKASYHHAVKKVKAALSQEVED